MKKLLCVFCVALFAPWYAAADGDLAKLKSNHTVKETLDRLSAALSENGVTIFARIDHAKGAASIGSDLKPTEVLIFGNPKMGTPLIQTNRTIGLDLPLKVVAWEDEGGATWVAYTKPEILKQRYGIEDKDKLFATMDAVLQKMTTKATAE